MNKHIDFDLETAEAVTSPRMKRAEGVLKRQPLRAIGIRRLMRGGRLNDAGRLPRYALTLFLGLVAIWAPVAAYLALSPKGYSAGATLILPGAGSNASVNLSEIGQASSSAASPFSSSAVSPTVTYKALLASARVRAAAAEALGVAYTDLPEPRVRLTDQTSLIRFDVKSGAPENAALAAEAVLAAFLAELDKLRSDEIARREDGFRAAIGEYKASVDRTRTAITRLKEESGLLSVSQYERLVVEADELALRVRDADAEAARKEDALKALAAALSLTPEAAARFLRLAADPEFKLLAEAMAQHSASAAAARATYGHKHPTRIAIEQALAGARAKAHARAAVVTGFAIEEVAERVDFSGAGERGALMAEMVRLKSELEGLNAERIKLTAALEAAEAEVRALVAAASELDDLGRDYQVAEAVFTSALARTDTTKTDVFASYPLVQVLEPPVAPSEPSSPHVLVAIAGGAAATLMLIGAIILGWIRRPLIDRLVGKPEA